MAKEFIASAFSLGHTHAPITLPITNLSTCNKFSFHAFGLEGLQNFIKLKAFRWVLCGVVNFLHDNE